MSPSRPHQAELDFTGRGRGDGHAAWERERKEAIRALSKVLGLPIGRNVEVWLKGGVRLRGILKLKSDLTHLTPSKAAHAEFVVKGIPFTQDEIESCVVAS